MTWAFRGSHAQRPCYPCALITSAILAPAPAVSRAYVARSKKYLRVTGSDLLPSRPKIKYCARETSPPCFPCRSWLVHRQLTNTPVNFRTCRTVKRRGRKLEFFARARALKPKPRHNALPAKLSLTPRTGVFLSVSEGVSHAKLSSSHQVLPCTFSSFEPSYYYHPHVYKPYTRTRAHIYNGCTVWY